MIKLDFFFLNYGLLEELSEALEYIAWHSRAFEIIFLPREPRLPSFSVAIQMIFPIKRHSQWKELEFVTGFSITMQNHTQKWKRTQEELYKLSEPWKKVGEMKWLLTLKVPWPGDKSMHLEYASFLFVDSPGRHIRAQFWTVLKSFNCLVF